MATKIFVISGFLGAGKTTLIQKLLKEAFTDEKVVLIENDFGEISVDAALLKPSNIEVKEINSGCICCSLSGDFVKALKELLERFHPDNIIIEPSGVGKLSDIEEACQDSRVSSLIEMAAKITIVDVKRCKMYLENFGEFFENQIQNADSILLSRTRDFPDKIDDARKIIEELNPHAPILFEDWDNIEAGDILYPKQVHPTLSSGETCQCGHQGHHPGQDHDCCHSHHHSHDCGHHHHHAEEIFDTITIRTEQIYNKEDLKARVLKIVQNTKGRILRAKGIVPSRDGYLTLQYLPDDLQITPSDAAGNMLCFIGNNLNRQELIKLFNEVII